MSHSIIPPVMRVTKVKAEEKWRMPRLALLYSGAQFALGEGKKGL